jgi:hypothetical protein
MSELIDRQAAIEAIAQCTNCGDEETLREYVLKHNLDNGWTGGILEALDAVKDLPTAQPERKEGHWIRRDCGLDVECKCSVCGYKDFVSPHDTYWFKRNYCPNCGAKMTISTK